MAKGQDRTGPRYCRRDHTHIKGPIQGWKGIKDGIMTIDGDKPIEFKAWLVDLKEK